MDRSTRKRSILCAAAATALVFLLAAGLPSLRLEPGLPLPPLEGGGPPRAAAAPLAGSTSAADGIMRLILVGVFALGVLFEVLFAAYQVIRRVEWSRAFRSIAGASIAILGIGGALCLAFALLQDRVEVPFRAPPPPPGPGARAASLGRPAGILFWLAGAVLASLVGLACSLALRARKSGPSAGELVGREAEAAIRALLAGRGLGDVVTDCYRNMGEVLGRDRGIERGTAMTTREFEDDLARAGIPAESVRELTRLFEAVRYGWSAPGPEEGERAIRCLEAIVGSCRDAAAAPAAGTGTRE